VSQNVSLPVAPLNMACDQSVFAVVHNNSSKMSFILPSL
jgi:hypothetical protein